MNKELLQEMIDKKYVSVQKHPTEDLFIYNYTPEVQYGKLWNEITLATRGLILDKEGNVVAKPFGKFFNLEEHQPSEIPLLDFEVFEKLDGSLGILYWISDMPFIATRGSFTSTQSVKATEILYSKYRSTFSRLDKSETYLFEIIYPENRIVCNYGEKEDLILLTIINNETGIEYIEDIGFPVVKRFDGIKDIAQLKALEEENKEGFVIRFSNGFRVKVKFDEYVRLHRIITGVSNVTVWEYLMEERPFDELLEKVPDEFYDWLTNTKKGLIDKFNEIYSVFIDDYAEIKKDIAVKAYTKRYPHLIFQMFRQDEEKARQIIWKSIRPKFSKAFKTDEQ